MKKIFIFILPVLLLGCEKDPSTPTLYVNSESIFSVSDTSCVSFVKGYLEYASRDSYSHEKGWNLGSLLSIYGHSDSKFADAVELFQYGASGYNNVRPGVQNNESILPTGDICGTNYDWGVYCNINGVSKDEHFRVLTADEWDYIYSKRDNAAQLRQLFDYFDNTYLLFFPDNWIGSYNQKVYSTLSWKEPEVYKKQVTIDDLHNLGIVVIPFIKAGYSYNYPTAKSGMYWTSTYGAAFSVYDGVIYNIEPNCFLAVQLVKDVKK